jgi:sugar porter (SP) family MFS transporter
MVHKTEDHARNILGRIGELNTENVLEQIRNSLMLEGKNKSSMKDLALNWVRPALIIGIGIMILQQFTGIITMIYYSPTIFEMAGFGVDTADPVRNAILPSLPIGLINVLFTLVAIYLVDRWGRKPLLYLGLTGMIISLVVLGIAFTFHDALGSSLKWISLCSMIVYIPFFAVSLGPVAWLLISEVYPTKIRGLGMSIATMVNWLSNFLISNTFLTLGRITTGEMPEPSGEGMLTNPGGAFIIYSIMGVLGLFFVRHFIPETKGHSLEEIEEHFKKGKPAKDL